MNPKQDYDIELINDCPLGGDINNDCADCPDSIDYRYDSETGLCIER
jgi:hypothetical protein